MTCISKNTKKELLKEAKNNKIVANVYRIANLQVLRFKRLTDERRNQV